MSKRLRAGLTAGLMCAGAAMGALVGYIAELLLSMGSFSGVFGVAAHPGEPMGIVIMTGLGMLLGIVAAAAIVAESLHVEVSDKEISLRWKGAGVRVRKDLVSAIHVGTDLVLYSTNGAELARVQAVNPLRLRCALIHHGYPTPTNTQQGEDEFTSDYSILGENERRIAEARTRALRAGNSDIAEILRRQLAGMGVMSRDLRTGWTSVRTEFRRLDPFRAASLKA